MQFLNHAKSICTRLVWPDLNSSLNTMSFIEFVSNVVAIPAACHNNLTLYFVVGAGFGLMSNVACTRQTLKKLVQTSKDLPSTIKQRWLQQRALVPGAVDGLIPSSKDKVAQHAASLDDYNQCMMFQGPAALAYFVDGVLRWSIDPTAKVAAVAAGIELVF
jgi:hypothetical protein